MSLWIVTPLVSRVTASPPEMALTALSQKYQRNLPARSPIRRLRRRRQFEALFSVHCTGCTTHTHVLVHFNGTIYPDGTYGGGVMSHVC